ncbi:MAG: hypothetical protein ACOH1N_12450 [Lutibacter sp.]
MQLVIFQKFRNFEFFEIDGVFYEDYKNMLLLQSQLNQAKRETLSGTLKRIVNKIKTVWQTH